MPIRVTCACGKAYHFKDEFAGRRAKCPACGQVIQIPNQLGGGSAPATEKAHGQQALSAITPKSTWNTTRQTPSSLQLAGFWRRVVACMVDGTIVLLGGSITGILVMLPAVAILLPLLISLSDSQQGEVGKRVFGLGFLGFAWLYFAWMESSRWQATLGKMLLRLKVVCVDGTRPSFGRTTGRFFGKILSLAIFYMGFIMVAFTARKQGLHDIMAGCLVVRR